MNDSTQIDLEKLFVPLKDEAYCIIKLNEDFPDYRPGSDLDIFCYDLSKMANLILRFGNHYVAKGWRIKTSTLAENHVQIDFFPKGSNTLDIKFDLYGHLPNYTRIQFKEGLFTRVIDHAVAHKCVKTPGKIDEMILRYAEYVEYYNIRADKIKHVDYILKKASEAEREQFLDKLHYYTAIPEEKVAEKTFRQECKSKIIKLICLFVPVKKWRRKLKASARG